MTPKFLKSCLVLIARVVGQCSKCQPSLLEHQLLRAFCISKHDLVVKQLRQAKIRVTSSFFRVMLMRNAQVFLNTRLFDVATRLFCYGSSETCNGLCLYRNMAVWHVSNSYIRRLTTTHCHTENWWGRSNGWRTCCFQGRGVGVGRNFRWSRSRWKCTDSDSDLNLDTPTPEPW
jgi:hypothetical protein